jgi:hypothetical protein
MLQKLKVHLSLILIVLCGFAFTASAQKKTSFFQWYGNAKSGTKNLPGAEIKVYENGNVVQTVQAKDNGGFILMFDLGHDYTVVFSKDGYIAKSMLVNTVVPADQTDMGYSFKANIELLEDVGDAGKTDPMKKPVGKLAYSTTYEDFDYDAAYTKRVQQEQQDALHAAADEKRDRERARLDSLNKAWGDSIAKNRVRDSTMLSQKNASEKAKQDSITRANAAAAGMAAAEKAKADSVARAEAERKRLDEIARNKLAADSIAAAKSALAAAQKARQDSIAKATLAERARQDSLSRADAAKKKVDELARQKALADSTALAQAELKKQQDEAKAKLAADAKEKTRQDSIARADAAAAKLAEAARQKAAADSSAKALARQKFVQDSTAKVNAAEAAKQKALADAQAKAAADSIAKVRANEAARQKALAEATEKARVDSLAKAKVEAEAARKKFVTDSTAQAQADHVKEKARQDSLTRADANARAIAEAKRKAEADSIARAEVERQKQEALAKAKADEEARIKAEQDRQQAALAEKARQDSVAAAAKTQKDKEDADKKAVLAAELQAKKDALAKANTYEKTEKKAPSMEVPKIVASDYREGITEETIKESNRNIERTVVKKDGVTNNYQKITYNWGGIYYYKNEAQITQTTFSSEVNTARKNFK